MTGEHRKPETADELKHDIEQTRAQLADTMDALAYKADIPARVKGKASETSQAVKERSREMTDDALEKLPPAARERAEHAVESVRRNPAPAALAAGGLLLTLLLLLRRMTNRKAS